jgi:hypothetical protein
MTNDTENQTTDSDTQISEVAPNKQSLFGSAQKKPSTPAHAEHRESEFEGYGDLAEDVKSNITTHIEKAVKGWTKDGSGMEHVLGLDTELPVHVSTEDSRYLTDVASEEMRKLGNKDEAQQYAWGMVDVIIKSSHTRPHENEQIPTAFEFNRLGEGEKKEKVARFKDNFRGNRTLAVQRALLRSYIPIRDLQLAIAEEDAKLTGKEPNDPQQLRSGLRNMMRFARNSGQEELSFGSGALIVGRIADNYPETSIDNKVLTSLNRINNSLNRGLANYAEPYLL